ncbi:MAG: hypothetical protein ACOYM2_05530 [Rectinemataceae bacterium]
MWDYFEPIEGIWYRWDINGAEVWLFRTGDEWRLGVKPIRLSEVCPLAEGPYPAEGEPDFPILVTVARSRTIALRPVMPTQPFLISARNDVSLMGGLETRFLVDLPASLRFELATGEFVGEWRPVLLSNTWFGDRMDGSLCLAMPMALDPMSIEELRASASGPRSGGILVRCEILLRNSGKASLDLSQLAVWSELLPIWNNAGFLSTCRVRMDGLPDGALRTSVDLDAHEPGAKLLSQARVGQSERLVRSGVNFLRAITGLR